MWCVGFREVLYIQPPRVGKAAIPAPRRVAADLGLALLQRVLAGRSPVFLPEHRGAGPCGSLGRYRGPGTHAVQHYAYADGSIKAGSSLTWSVRHLVEPLQREYAALPRATGRPGGIPGLALGAKSGGGNGRRALY